MNLADDPCGQDSIKYVYQGLSNYIRERVASQFEVQQVCFSCQNICDVMESTKTIDLYFSNRDIYIPWCLTRVKIDETIRN